MNAPALLLRWISSFLKDRAVKVRILGRTSNTRRSLFADDFMICTESSITRSHLIRSNLQTSMDDLTLFNSNHRIILSCTKSVRVLFKKRKSNRLNHKTSLIMVRSSLLRHLSSSLVSPLTLLSPSDLTSVLSPLLPVIAS